VLSLAATFGAAVLYNNTDDDTLNPKALFIGIAGLVAAIHAVHAILIFILPAFNGGTPRDQSDMEVVVRNKMSQLLLISSAAALGMGLRGGSFDGLELKDGNVLPELLLVLIAVALRISDLFDDQKKAADVVAIVQDSRDGKASHLPRMVIGNVLYVLAALLLIVQFAEEEAEGKSGNRDTEGRDIAIAAMSLVIIHAALKPLIKTAELVGGDNLKQAIANTFLADKATSEDVELASLSQLPIVRLVVATTILSLAGLQLGETWADSRDVNFIAGCFIGLYILIAFIPVVPDCI
jgi:hypothetical protein